MRCRHLGARLTGSRARSPFPPSFSPLLSPDTAYCKAVKTLLEEQNAGAKVYELDLMDEGADWQVSLPSLIGLHWLQAVGR